MALFDRSPWLLLMKVLPELGVETLVSVTAVYCTVGHPKFFGVSWLAQILKVYQVSGPSTDVWPRLQCSEAQTFAGLLAWGGHLRSSANVVKRPRRNLKLGIPSGFGPISSLEFEAWDPEKFGQPYCAVVQDCKTPTEYIWVSDKTCPNSDEATARWEEQRRNNKRMKP